MNKRRRAAYLSRICRKLIYLSGSRFDKGVSLFALAAPQALKILNLDGYSGSAKRLISDNLPKIEEYLKVNSKEVTRVTKERKEARLTARIARNPNAAKFHAQIPYTVSDEHNRYLASHEFLESYEWRKLRMEALIKYGRRCLCCGATPQTGAVMNVDHIKPRKLFPELALSIDNLQILCSECNHGKGNWDQTDWR